MFVESKFTKDKYYFPYVNLKMKKIIHLQETSNCTTKKTFYSCISSRVKCSRNCTTFLKQDLLHLEEANKTLPFCEGDDEVECTLKYNTAFFDSFKECPNSCIQKSYYGDITIAGESAASMNENETGFVILFASKDVHEEKETLAYEVPDVIGSVGGTLGLFVGFSFYGVVTIPLKKLLDKGTK